MTIDRLAAALLLVFTAACAADPIREPQRPATVLASERQPATKASTATTTEQLADLVSRYRDPAAVHPPRGAKTAPPSTAKDVSPDLTGATADVSPDLTDADGQVDGAAADKPRNHAAALPKERATITEDARARLSKADGHVALARNRSTHLTEERRARFTASYNLFSAKRSEVQRDIASIGRSTGADHAAAKARLERSLGDLEALAARLD